MDSFFTKNEIEIFKAWLLKKKNREIADEMQTSEAYVSQTIKKIHEKINTLENSLNMLNQMGLILPKEELKLTKKGKESYEKAKEKFKEKSKSKSKDVDMKNLLDELSKQQMFFRTVDIVGTGLKKTPSIIGEMKAEDAVTRDAYLHFISDPHDKWRFILNETNRSKQIGKAPSELDYNSVLLRAITERMLMSVSVSKVTEDTSTIIATLKEVINNLYQLLEWLNPQGQLQQTFAR